MTQPNPPASACAQAQARAQAEAWMHDLAVQPLHSPEFRRQVASLQALGEGAQRRAARASAGTPWAGPTEWLQDLQQLSGLLRQLQPQTPTLWGRLRGKTVQPPTPTAYAQAVSQAEPLLARLYRAGDDLRRQEVHLAAEIQHLQSCTAELADARLLADELELVLHASLPDLTARQPLHAAAVQEEVLVVVAGRRHDLSTALAVAVQGSLALDVARQQSAALREQLERATEEVVSALRLARRATEAAALREQAIQANTKLMQAQHVLASEATPEQLSAALAQALAALDELARLEI